MAKLYTKQEILGMITAKMNEHHRAYKEAKRSGDKERELVHILAETTIENLKKELDSELE